MPVRPAYLFPTFAFRHREFRHDALAGYAAIAGELAARASAVAPISSRTFAPPDPAAQSAPQAGDDALEATLQGQYASYIETVAMGRWLEERFPPAVFVAGYSMGMFAAACHAGALGFEDGLTLMRDVCVDAHRHAPPGRFAIGAVIGLPIDAVRALVPTASPVEITDHYSAHIALLTGPEADVADRLDAARRAGAPETRLTPFSAPFHSSRLAPVEARTAERLARVQVSDPRCAMVSPVTLEFMTSADQIRAEIARNVACAMDWYGTIRALLSRNTDVLLECGGSTNLTNLAREDVPGACEAMDFRDFQSIPSRTE